VIDGFRIGKVLYGLVGDQFGSRQLFADGEKAHSKCPDAMPHLAACRVLKLFWASGFEKRGGSIHVRIPGLMGHSWCSDLLFNGVSC